MFWLFGVEWSGNVLITIFVVIKSKIGGEFFWVINIEELLMCVSVEAPGDVILFYQLMQIKVGRNKLFCLCSAINCSTVFVRLVFDEGSCFWGVGKLSHTGAGFSVEVRSGVCVEFVSLFVKIVT